ncbi:MAG: M3 family metallopeptidase [Deltaproteobacteria bacterium]|nr:M3 family metallopeptidase [Deltaproteobacteria bacterium]
MNPADNALLFYARTPQAHGGLPPFPAIAADQVVPAIDALLEALKADQKTLEDKLSSSSAALSYADVVEAVADLTEPIERAWGVVGHLMGVKNSPALREAQQLTQPKVVLALMALAQSPALFQALSNLRASPSFALLSASRQRIVEKKLLEARLAGIALQGAEKERFNAIEQELSELATRFSNNVLDATKAWSLTLDDAADVDGLPASWKAMASTSGDAEKGPWKVTLDMPGFQPFMRYGTRTDLREKIYRAYLARASELDGGQHDNRPLITRILELRHEKARLLGFDGFAALSLATKMAPSTSAVHQLLDELRAVSLPVAKEELQELERIAGRPLKHWDVEFYAEKLRQQRYDYSEEELRNYFAFPAVLEGLFALVKRLFGVDVVDDTANVARWHDDVRFFRVLRAGQPIAAFFLDPYARPADKRGGAWMDDCVNRRVTSSSSPSSARLPVAYLVCNQPPPPAPGKPALLPFRDVETLFHEFGHGLQHMLTSVDDVDASGIRGVEWDAVELPSQFMENWCTNEATLMGFAKHVDTGAPLPADLLGKVKAQKTFRQASIMMRQLLFATVDLALHTKPLAAGESAFDVHKTVAMENAVLPVLDEDRFLASFSHIFAGGYAAGYYSYKWAEVLSADAFAAFEEAGVDDDAQVRLVGARFRDTVLSLGGSVHPLEVFQRFRGRAPSTTALLRHAGLLKG